MELCVSFQEQFLKMWTSDLQLRITWESLLIDYLNGNL